MSVPPVDPPVGRPRRYAAWVRSALLVAGVVLALLAVGHYAHGVSGQLRRLSVAWLVPSLAAAVLGALATMLGWRALLRALAHDLRRRDAARIFFVSQVGKYLPGSVWPYIAQMDMAGQVGVPAVTMGVAGLLSIIVGLVTAGLTAAVVLPFVASGSLGHYWPALLVLLPLAVLLHPAVLRRAVVVVRRVTRRAGPVPELSARGMVAPTGWWLASWVAWGLHIWFITLALHVHDGSAVVLSIGGFALAWLVGFLVVISPAGAGAREAVLVVVLSPVLTADGALVVALVSRLLTTLTDVVLALLAAGLGRRRRSSAGSAARVGREQTGSLAGAGPTAPS